MLKSFAPPKSQVFNNDVEMGCPKTDRLRTEIKKVMLTFRGMVDQQTVSQKPKLPGYHFHIACNQKMVVSVLLIRVSVHTSISQI